MYINSIIQSFFFFLAKLGANAILGVSIAVAKAGAAQKVKIDVFLNSWKENFKILTCTFSYVCIFSRKAHIIEHEPILPF